MNLMDEEANAVLDELVSHLQLPYQLAEFQRVTINALAQKQNVILVSPTGSGKMSIPLLATQVLRRLSGISKGICIVTQPLTRIMNEKLHNNICNAAVLSMRGHLSTSEDEESSLSCDFNDLINGKYDVLFCHPESCSSPLGQKILRELQRREMIILICIDEFRQGGYGHWHSFRPDTMKMSTGLRLYGIKDCPTLAMSATLTKDEIDDVIRALGLRKPPTILTASPVQSHIKFSIIRRPSNNYGLDGSVVAEGVKKPGLMDILHRIYLR